jgi:hypothetical protein
MTTARAWGELWHLTGEPREARNHLLRQRDVHDYAFVDWLYGPKALTPDEEPPMFAPQPPAVPVSRARAGPSLITGAAAPTVRAGRSCRRERLP